MGPQSRILVASMVSGPGESLCLNLPICSSGKCGLLFWLVWSAPSSGYLPQGRGGAMEVGVG